MDESGFDVNFRLIRGRTLGKPFSPSQLQFLVFLLQGWKVSSGAYLACLGLTSYWCF